MWQSSYLVFPTRCKTLAKIQIFILCSYNSDLDNKSLVSKTWGTANHTHIACLVYKVLYAVIDSLQNINNNQGKVTSVITLNTLKDRPTAITKLQFYGEDVTKMIL